MSNYEIQQEKLNNLLKWHKDNDINKIIEATTDEDAIVRSESVLILGRLGRKDLTSVIKNLLQDKDQHVRYCAAESLGINSDEDAVSDLIDSAVVNSEFVRCKSIDALGKIHSDKSVNFLIQMLFDNSNSVKIEASKALTNLLNFPSCQAKLQEFFNLDESNINEFQGLYNTLQIQIKYKNINFDKKE